MSIFASLLIICELPHQSLEFSDTQWKMTPALSLSFESLLLYLMVLGLFSCFELLIYWYSLQENDAYSR